MIDLQHSPTGRSEQLAAMLRATGTQQALVRIPWKTDYGTAMAALDAGAQLGGSCRCFERARMKPR